MCEQIDIDELIDPEAFAEIFGKPKPEQEETK